MKLTAFKIILIMAAFALMVSYAYAEGEVLKIAKMSGKVMVLSRTSGEWSDAKIGQALAKEDSIRTGEDGKALLEFSDNSSLTLKPGTEISIDDLVWEEAAKKVNVGMTAGALKVLIKTPSDFKVRTPTGICGARGTVFYVFVVGTDTRVFVDEGAIDFSNNISGNTYVVIQGMESIASVTGTLTEPRELTGAEKEAALAGWDPELVGEAYSEPGIDNARDPGTLSEEYGDFTSQQIIQENPAQENEASRV
jgi:hypothetical protein